MKQLVSLLNKLARVGLAASMVMAISPFAYSEGPKISGFIDTTYTYNFDRPNSRTTVNRSFDRRAGDILLNAIQVNLEGSAGEGIGYYGELAFGTDPSIYKSAGAGTDPVSVAGLTDSTGGAVSGTYGNPSAVPYNVELQEAYITYKCPMTSVMVKAGKFVTYEGIEVIESILNPTITRGFLFGLAEPYTHLGAVAGYQVNPMVDVWAGVVNGWDVHVDNNNAKTFVAKVGLVPSEKASGSISFYRGAEGANNTTDRLTSLDTTWLVKPMSDVAVALQINGGEQERATVPNPNGTIGGTVVAAGHWYGFGIQPTLTLTDKISLGARYEWFSDKDGVRTGTAATGGRVLQNITLAPTFMCSDALTFRAEYRYDVASRGMYEKSDGSTTKDSASTVSAEFVYKF